MKSCGGGVAPGRDNPLLDEPSAHHGSAAPAADREINSGCDDHHRHPDCNDGNNHHALGNILEIVDGKECGLLPCSGVRTELLELGYFSGTAWITSIPAGPAVAIAPRERPSSRNSLSLTRKLRGAPIARRTLLRPSVLSRWARDLAKVSKSVLSFRRPPPPCQTESLHDACNPALRLLEGATSFTVSRLKSRIRTIRTRIIP